MVAELAIYRLVAGFAHRCWRLASVWSLLLAMAAGRIALGLAVALLGPSIGLKAEPVAYVLPGIAVQIVVIPLLLARGQPRAVDCGPLTEPRLHIRFTISMLHPLC
jgi:hypothetical protein